MDSSAQEFMNMIQSKGEKEAFLNWTRNSLGMGAPQEASLAGC
jgi:hypothetical protein